MNDLKGKIALVTGASSGIGKAITEQLIAKGIAKVYINARSRERLEKLSAKYSDVVEAIVFDVSDEKSIKMAVNKIDRVDLIVNNAGVALSMGNLFESNKADLMKEFEVNVVGPLLVTRALDKKISKAGATVVNILSEAALIPDDYLAGYSASKHAALSLSKSVRSVYKDRNIRVLTVFPGLTETEATQGFPGNKDDVKVVANDIVEGILDDSIQFVATGENGRKALKVWKELELEDRL